MGLISKDVMMFFYLMNVNIRPIHLAASNRNICIIYILLNKHDDVNIENKYGSIPLHYSVNSLNEDSTKVIRY